MADVCQMKFLTLGNRITKTKKEQRASTKIRRFKSFFGITPYVCSIVWKKISGYAPKGFDPKHLLWGLNFLKQYTSEHNRHTILKADEKTIRKWTWVAVKLLSSLKVIIWDPCGEYTDLKLAREAYVLFVDPGEKTMADKGYRDQNFFILSNLKNKSLHGRIMARHETVNRRMKQYQVLKQVFRHDISKHPLVFSAVANLTQLMLQNGEPLFVI